MSLLGIEIAFILACAVLAMILSLLATKISRLKSTYKILGEDKLSMQPLQTVVSELKTLVLIPPVAAFAGSILPNSPFKPNNYVFIVSCLSIFLYLFLFLTREFLHLYQFSGKTFRTPLLFALLVDRFSTVIVIVFPFLAFPAMFDPNQTVAVWHVSAASFLALFYFLLFSFSVLIPLLNDSKRLSGHLRHSALLGEALPDIEDRVKDISPYDHLLLNKLTDVLLKERADALKSAGRHSDRVVEFAINLAFARSLLRRAMIIEVCRKAAYRRKRVRALIQHRRGAADLFLDIGTVRDDEVCCIVWLDPDSREIPMSVRALDASRILSVEITDKDSCIAFPLGSEEAETWRSDAKVMEDDIELHWPWGGSDE